MQPSVMWSQPSLIEANQQIGRTCGRPSPSATCSPAHFENSKRRHSSTSPDGRANNGHSTTSSRSPAIETTLLRGSNRAHDENIAAFADMLGVTDEQVALLTREPDAPAIPTVETAAFLLLRPARHPAAVAKWRRMV